MSTRTLVTHHGALADGQTDDAPAILRAAACAADRGGALVFPPGEYRLGRALELSSGAAPRILGAGALLRPASGHTGAGLVLTGDAAEGALVEGLGLRGFSVGLRLVDARDARLRGLDVRGCGVGAELSGGENIGIFDSTFTDNEIDVSLGTGATGLSQPQLRGNRLGGPVPLRLVQEQAAARVTGLSVGPGDQLTGPLTIPDFAWYTTVLHTSCTSLTDAGQSSSLVGVPGLGSRVDGHTLLRVRRGLAVPVASGTKVGLVSLSPAEPDDQYALAIAPSWSTNWYIYQKSASGFEVRFSALATTNGRFDWILVR